MLNLIGIFITRRVTAELPRLIMHGVKLTTIQEIA